MKFEAVVNPTAPGSNLSGPDRSSVSTTRPYRIVFADDEEFSRKALAFILRENGFEVAEASNGHDLIRQANASTCDLLLIDINMPHCDGLRALSTLRTQPIPLRIPAVILTNHAARDYVVRAARLGVSEFLLKRDLNLTLLVQKLNKHIEDAPQVVPSETAQNPVNTKSTQSETSDQTSEATEEKPKSIIRQQEWKDQAITLGRLTKDDLTLRLENLKLPLIQPDSITDLQTRLRNEHTSTDDLLELMAQEPALTVGALQTANRSDSGAGHVLTLENVINWLGRTGISEIAKNVAEESSELPEAAQPWVWRWWSHSVATSSIARDLAEQVGIPPDQAQLAGFLHDIGRLCFYRIPEFERIISCYDQSRNMSFPTVVAEQMLFSQNHRQAGARYIFDQGLPKYLSLICEHHDADATYIRSLPEDQRLLLAVVKTANELAKSYGLGSLPGDELQVIPASVLSVDAVQPNRISATFAELQTLLTWKLPKTLNMSMGEPRSAMSGVVVAMLFAQKSHLNSYANALQQGGATVRTFKSFDHLVREKLMADLVLIDMTEKAIGTTLPEIRRLMQTDWLVDIPKLILARRSDDAPMILSQGNIDIPVYESPIRINQLKAAVRNIVDG